MIIAKRFKFFAETIVTFAVCVLVVTLHKKGLVQIRFPLIIAIMLLTFWFNPLRSLLNSSEGSSSNTTLLMIGKNTILTFIVGFLGVLVFTIEPMALQIGWILATLSSLYLIVLLVYRKLIPKSTIAKFWTITTLFIGVLSFLR